MMEELTSFPGHSMNPPNAHRPLRPRVFHVLLALHAGPQHGYGIKMAIRGRTGGAVDLDPGGLYRLIGRLEDEGLLEPVERPRSDGEKEDSRRRYYALTALGQQVVRAEARRLTELAASSDVAALAAETDG